MHYVKCGSQPVAITLRRSFGTGGTNPITEVAAVVQHPKGCICVSLAIAVGSSRRREFADDG
jgi:hypothetical protein